MVLTYDYVAPLNPDPKKEKGKKNGSLYYFLLMNWFIVGVRERDIGELPPCCMV